MITNESERKIVKPRLPYTGVVSTGLEEDRQAMHKQKIYDFNQLPPSSTDPKKLHRIRSKNILGEKQEKVYGWKQPTISLRITAGNIEVGESIFLMPIII